MENAMMGINQQKNAIIKQRLTSSVSIFFISPYFTIRIRPRAPIPTITIDQPTISHLKKSDTALRSFLEYWNGGILVKLQIITNNIVFPHHSILPLSHRSSFILPLPVGHTFSSEPGNWGEASPPLPLPSLHSIHSGRGH